MASVTITGIYLQSGTDRTVYVTWNSTLSNVDYYLVTWHYMTGDGVGFEGGSEEIKQDVNSATHNATYSAPSNATSVHGWVKPVAKTHTVNGKDTAYWTGSWAYSDKYYFSNNPPDTPSTPSIEVGDTANSSDQYKITVSVDSISDSKTDYMEFYFRKNGKSKIASVYAKKSKLMCTAYLYVSPGATYAVAARAINDRDSGTKTKIGLVDGTSVTLHDPVYSSWSSYTSEVSPPPDGPTNPKVSAFSETAVKMSWTKATGATGYEVQYAKEKVYLQKSSNETSSETVDNVTTTYITGLDSGNEWFFKVRATNDVGNSGWSDIVSTVIGTDPEAPTTWSSTTTAMIGDIVNLYWVHNCEDGSDQTGAQIMITPSTAVMETVTITSDTTSYALDTSKYSDGTEITWQVRTMGITGKYGDWSTARTIKINAPATISIEMSSVLNSFPFYIVAEAGPSSQKAISYYISVFAMESYETTGPTGETLRINAGEEIYSKLYNTSSDVMSEVVLTLSVGDLTLTDGVTYKVTVTVVMNTGLSAEVSEEFIVQWDAKSYTPDAGISIDFQNLTAYISPYCEELIDYEEGDNIDEAPRELVTGITLAVYRREADGSFVLIGDGIENNGSSTIVDPHPALDFARYRIVAQDDETGQISYEDLPGIAVSSPYIVMQWDEDWSDFDYVDEPEMADVTWSGSMVKIKGNVDVSESHNPDNSIIEYIGREHPVSYYGTQLGETATWSADVPKDDEETIYALRRLAKYLGDVYVREPSGTGYWAQVTISMDTKHCDLTVPVSFNITRVEGGV